MILAFTTAVDFPAIYQQAVALIYPSIFEGFGLPVLEAMWSRLPVICSNTFKLAGSRRRCCLVLLPYRS
jgi:glycosyltransferase involved in cell wall biosynthesis